MAWRALWKNPGFMLIAIAALALGIGANTAIFSVIDRVLLRPLPYKDSERIMQIRRHYPQGDGSSTSIPFFVAWRKAQSFQSMAMYDFGTTGLGFGTGDNPPEIAAMHVTAQFFDVFGVQPVIGRTFTTQEDSPHTGNFAVVTHQFWRDHMASDPAAAGKTILLGRQPYVVLGVLPEGFGFESRPDVFLPLQIDPESTNLANIWWAAGRLMPGVTPARARAEMNVICNQLRARFSEVMDKSESVSVVTVREATGQGAKSALLILGGAVAFVLLIACANVANLLLARAAGRQREIAIRTAIGASRARIVRQLLGESVVLALAGGVAGFLIGIPGVRAMLALSPDIPRIEDFLHSGWSGLLDTRVMLFTVAVSVVTAVLFGLMPAVQVSRLDVSSSLKESSGRAGTGMRHNRMRGALVVSEVALAVVLLAGAALLIRTFAGMRHVEPGIDLSNVLTFTTSFSGGRYDQSAQGERMITRAVERMESIPGVKAAAMAAMLPFNGGFDLSFIIEGRVPAQGQVEGGEDYRYVSPHYFKALGIPLVRGRLFDDRDNARGPHVALVNQAFARKYWPKGDPIGARIEIGVGIGKELADTPREIVGVVGNVREDGLGRDIPPVMYIPQGQVPDAINKLANGLIPMSWIVRTQTDPLKLGAPATAEVRGIDAQLAPSKIRTIQQVMADSMQFQEFNAMLLTVFAVVALALAAVGIYGVLAYTVQQRAQEIGIRMALGARYSSVVGMVLGQGLRLAGIGVAIGLAAAFALTRVLSAAMSGLKVNDPWTFGAVAAMLIGVAALAAFVPAHRATRVDPVIALRSE